MMKHSLKIFAVTTLLSMSGCFSEAPEGLARAPASDTTVKMDFFHKPLPEIPLPNDIATRYDPESATGRRINVSMVAPTAFERRTRDLIGTLDGWGTFMPIVVPFTGPLDIASILAGHRDEDFDTSNDVIYVINIDPSSSKIGQITPLDLGNGNYPVVVERRFNYWKNDPRGESMSLSFEEYDEDLNGNGILDLGEDVNGNGRLDPGEDLDGDGILDPPEDTDADGVLDVPNYLPGATPAWDDLAGRTDALMTFYERQTNTLIARVMEPLDERTRYAVVITRRLLDEAGKPVGSPYRWINHSAQTEELRPLLDHLPAGLELDDIAYAFSFTTQTIISGWAAAREGLYERGVQAHLGREFPARLHEILPARDEGFFPDMINPYVLYAEQWIGAYEALAAQIDDLDSPGTEDVTRYLDSLAYIDYFVIASFDAPQLFERYDANGEFLHLDDQSWPPDIDLKKVTARRERIYVTISVPRKEISARGQGKPAPVVIVGHGYTGNRFSGMTFAGFLAQHGLAMMSIDGPSHGIELNDVTEILIRGVMENYGMRNFIDAVLMDRAMNLDHDPLNKKDSGADFWTSYLFHTRDIVRQFALDYSQLTRIVRSFDGSRRWAFDVNGDGIRELAGDFDGDGVIDIGGDAPISMLGGSLGGIMSMVMGGSEPEITAIASISGGGGYGDMGLRSTQGGAVEGFILRAMAPLFVGTVDSNGSMLIETIIPDLNRKATVEVARIDDVKPWDTFLVRNLVNGEVGCGFVSPNGTVRVSAASDEGDRLSFELYDGPQLAGKPDCVLREGAKARVVIDTFGMDAVFQFGKDGWGGFFEAGSPLVSFADGLGQLRTNPDLRRFQGLGQLVLDPGDPINFARGLGAEPFVFEATGEKTGARALIITTLGDTAVPAATGAAFARAAGFIDYRNPDPRYGKPVNQVLVDNFVMEGVHNLKRYTNPAGDGIHIDVENFSGGDDLWGSDIPRLSEPVRLPFQGSEYHPEGISGAVFPFSTPDGQHGFDMPGKQIEKARRTCRNACTDTSAGDPCDCDSVTTFDIGTFMLNMLGRFLASGGTLLSDDLCQSRDDCPDRLSAPAPRDPAELR